MSSCRAVAFGVFLLLPIAALNASFESVTNHIDSDDVVHGRLEIEIDE